jgi:hypothetical protein
METYILKQLLEDGLGAFDPEKLRQEDCPDFRFSLLQDSFAKSGWAELETEAERQFSPEEFGDLFLPSDEAKRDFPRQRYLEFQQWLCERFATVLAGSGATTLSGGVRQKEAEKLFKTLESEGEEVLFSVQYEDIDNPREGHREALEAQLGERLMLCESPPPAKIVYPEILSSANVIIGQPNHIYHFITVRPIARLLEQYQMPAESRELLETSESAGMCVNALYPGNSRELFFYPFFDPADVRQMAEIWTGRAGILVNVSLSALRTEAWMTRWLPSLKSVAHLTALIDCNPRLLFDEWEEEGIEYTVHKPALAGSAKAPRGALIACTPESSLKMKYYALSSPRTVDRIEGYAKTSPVFRTDDSHDSHDERPLIDHLLAHHLTREPWFDFRAGLYARD